MFPRAVQRGLLGLPVQSHGADDFSRDGINGGGVRAAPVERENALRLRIVNDRVRIFSGSLDYA